MSEALPVRKLAAILHADVAGYSRLMGEDEAGTHRTPRQFLDAIARTINNYPGRVVNYSGDAVLADFTTVTDALSAAVSIQDDINVRNRALALPEDRQIQFRIGVHLGEVIVDGDDIYGDGVNVAARLESLADAGGICISLSALDAVGNKLPLAYEDMGEQQVKNIAKPVQAYRVRVPEGAVIPAPSAVIEAPVAQVSGRRRIWLTTAVAITVLVIGGGIVWLFYPQATTFVTGTMTESSEAPALPDKPSIAVLPFDNMSADPEQEYFVDGMTDDLITDLSKLSGLLVIARNAAFVYKGQSVNPQQVAEELGVRYVLEGSVRKAGGRIRINAQLVDSASGGHLWAERYDRELTDIFDLQDEVIEQIVAALDVQLNEREQQQLARRYTENVDAHDYFLRGQALLRTADYHQARELYRQAIALDPAFARAYGALALAYSFSNSLPLADDPQGDLAQALELAVKAKSMNDTIPQIRMAVASAYMMNRQLDQALFEAQEAVALDPGYFDGNILLAQIHNFIGKPQEAVGFIEEAMRFSPNLNAPGLRILGTAYLLTGELEKAIKTLHAARDRNTEDLEALVLLTLAYYRSGQLDEAEWEASELLMIYSDFSVERWGASRPYRNPAQFEQMMEDLRQAGVMQYAHG